MHKIVIGTNQVDYLQKRNFIDLPYQDVQFKKCYDTYKIPAFLKFKLFRKVDYRLVNRFNDFGINKVNIYHFFNAITPLHRPWIVTFETSLPRARPGDTRGLRWLSSRHCKAIIGYSQRAIRLQLALLRQQPSFEDSILQKMHYLSPAQKLVVKNMDEKPVNEVPHGVFIGRAFYRKGGYQLLKAIELAHEAGLNLRFTIISSLEKDTYKGEFVTDEMVAGTNKLLESLPSVTHVRSLPNAEVMTILKGSDFGLLPSFGETYGFSILESMACGAPVICTDVSPFDEILDDQTGYRVQVPKELEGSEWVINVNDPGNYQLVHQQLVQGMFNVFEHIAANPAELKVKGQRCLDRIKEQHDPGERALFLENLYRKIVCGDI